MTLIDPAITEAVPPRVDIADVARIVLAEIDQEGGVSQRRLWELCAQDEDVYQGVRLALDGHCQFLHGGNLRPLGYKSGNPGRPVIGLDAPAHIRLKSLVFDLLGEGHSVVVSPAEDGESIVITATVPR